jgi:hypothetical protein
MRCLRPSQRLVAATLVVSIALASTGAMAAPPTAPPAPPLPAPAPAAAPPVAAKGSYALFRLDPLGIAPDIVDQLERILRVELERVLGQTLPSRAEVERVAAQNKKLAGCTADPECLAPLARALKAQRIVAGNVGGLADSYVVNLKLVDAAEARELRRVTATLRGSPEELIDEIRVAAYRLVAPERLVGSIALLSDVPGAAVTLDGKSVGVTPLAQPLAAVPVGVHKLVVTREGFSAFEEEVPVRFEKTTQVVVRQRATTKKAQRLLDAQGTPFYSKWWFWTAVGVVAVGVGIGVGFGIPKQSPVDCGAMPCR